LPGRVHPGGILTCEPAAQQSRGVRRSRPQGAERPGGRLTAQETLSSYFRGSTVSVLAVPPSKKRSDDGWCAGHRVPGAQCGPRVTRPVASCPHTRRRIRMWTGSDTKCQRLSTLCDRRRASGTGRSTGDADIGSTKPDRPS